MSTYKNKIYLLYTVHRLDLYIPEVGPREKFVFMHSYSRSQKLMKNYYTKSTLNYEIVYLLSS